MSRSVLLVTVDTDAQQELARQFQVRSLPTVKLFSNGEVIDEFVGALPASRVRAFIEPHIARESDTLADCAVQLAADGDTGASWASGRCGRRRPRARETVHGSEWHGTSSSRPS